VSHTRRIVYTWMSPVTYMNERLSHVIWTTSFTWHDWDTHTRLYLDAFACDTIFDTIFQIWYHISNVKYGTISNFKYATNNSANAYCSTNKLLKAEPTTN